MKPTKKTKTHLRRKLQIPPIEQTKPPKIDIKQNAQANEDYQCALCHNMLQYCSDNQWHCPACTGESKK